MSEVIKLIRKGMHNKRLNSRECAVKVGVSPQYLSKAFRFGTKNISLLQNLCDLLDIPDGRMLKALQSDNKNDLSLKWEENRKCN